MATHDRAARVAHEFQRELGDGPVRTLAEAERDRGEGDEGSGEDEP